MKPAKLTQKPGEKEMNLDPRLIAMNKELEEVQDMLKECFRLSERTREASRRLDATIASCYAALRSGRQNQETK